MRQRLRWPVFEHHEHAEVLVRLRKGRRFGDHLAQHLLRLFASVQLDEQRAKQRLHIDVARGTLERSPARASADRAHRRR
jgi:hypothetical protein